LDECDATYGIGLNGEIICSALSYLYGKTRIDKELVTRSQNEVLPEEIKITLIAQDVKDVKEVVKDVKEMRKKGVEINTLISLEKTNQKTAEELRVLGIKTITA
ncbi:MAG: hypothetical protein GOV15_00430, partial [Candidatus Diapherotrites archaeon]|nr:hypothetical protein [Candidatus Diapherotrites archaeon]